MPWVRLDEEFPDHPKVVTAGPLAGWLHVCALAYCNRHLTDGFVPHAQVGRLVNFAGIVDLDEDPGPMDARDLPDVSPYELAQRLVDLGMWEKRQGGYLIHDFLDYQPSRAEIEAQRKVKSEAGKAGGRRSGESRRSKAEAERKAETKHTTKQNGSRPEAAPEPTNEAKGKAKTKPDPVPDPFVDRSSSSHHGVGGRPVEEEEDLDVVDQALLAIATAKLDRCLNDPEHKPINDRAGWLAAVVAKDRMAFGAQMSTMAAAGATADLLVRTFDRQPAPAAGPAREQLPPAFEIDEATGMAVPVSA